MEHNRIQKLLLSEYCDFSDRVLIESPFAETTRDGRGLRQVALGLTSTRLVIAADILKKNSEFTCPPDLDPSIESFELVSIYPLEFIALSIFRRRKRRTLKARLIDGRANYYELGGMECRSMLWTLWCENVRDIVAKKQEGSSLSETTAASSSSASTLCLLSSGVEFRNNCKNRNTPRTCRVWANYGGAGDGQSTCWHRKDVYLGTSHDQLSHGYYTPVPVRFAGASLEDLSYELNDATPKSLACKKTCSSWPCSRNVKDSEKKELNRAGGLCDVLFTREHGKRGNKHQRSRPIETQASIGRGSLVFEKKDGRATASETSGISPSGRRNFFKIRQKRKSGSPRKHGGTSIAPKLSRFGFGVGENCSTGLYLEPWEGDQEHFRRARSVYTRINPYGLIDSGVYVWETRGNNDESSPRIKRMRHPRRYALATAAHFFHALGPWSVQPGERESVQRKRASSAVCIRRQPLEPELRLPVSKRQLAASVSMTSLDPGRTGTMSSSTRGRVVLFWTPEYWYRPRAATAAYRELRRHLSLLRDFRNDKERSSSSRKIFFCRRKRSSYQGDCRESTSQPITEERSNCILGRIFSSRDTKKRTRESGESREGGTSQLRHLLRMDLRITAWDLDSTTIARQLTLIDRELFQRIPCVEMEILVTQRSSRNAPNLGAWIAFSHRISCLTASQVLATKKLDMRTRIISRFINAADKCYGIGNFHSCRSILAGLQSPPVYRLVTTWSHLRTHHSTRYETMERLCKIYRNTRTRSYRRAWKRCESRPPLLPYVGDLLARILREDDKNEFSKFIDSGPGWKNRSCCFTQTHSPYSRGEFSSMIENACDKIVSKSLTEKEITIINYDKNNKDEIETEKLIESRRGIGRRMVSAAMMKMGYFKYDSPLIKKKDEDISWTSREQVLARKFYTRWRRFVLTSNIYAKNEARIRDMDPKKRRVMEISNWMSDCQRYSQGYNFPGHSLAWEFLLKARYREDRENFFISLKLEPSCG